MILDEAVHHTGYDWHKACWEKYEELVPSCSICNKPIVDAKSLDDQWHENCYLEQNKAAIEAAASIPQEIIVVEVDEEIVRRLSMATSKTNAPTFITSTFDFPTSIAEPSSPTSPKSPRRFDTQPFFFGSFFFSPKNLHPIRALPPLPTEADVRNLLYSFFLFLFLAYFS